MTVISFSGLASGLDTSSWVSALTALKNAKIESLQEERAAVVSLRDAVAGIKTYFNTFRNSLERLTDAKYGVADMDLFVQNLANSSDPSKVTAMATSLAARDEYEVDVKQVASNTRVNTAVRRTVTVNKTAAETTKLSLLGVREGFVSINNKDIQVEANDTIKSIVDKFNDIGINASYNEDKGRFTISTNVFDSDDGTTNLFASLGLTLQDVKGEQTEQLKTEGYVTLTADTLLADINATQGAITINNVEVDLNLGANATVQDFLDYINTNYAATGANATMDADGFISISGIDIVEQAGGSNIITALGLEEKIDSVTAETEELTYIVTESIKLDTKLGDINSTFPDYNLILGTSPTGGSTTPLNADSTIEDVKNAIINFANANGMSVDFDIDENGLLTISGDIDKLYISGGVAEGLGLEVDKVNGTSLQSSLLEYTHTLTAKTSTTWKELGITGENLKYEVCDERGNVTKPNLSVGENTTLEAWFNSLKQYGLEGSVNEDGVISIEGDGFISGNLATACRLGTAKSGEVVSETKALSNVLNPASTVKATMTTTLAELGINSNQELTMKVGGKTTTVTFTSASTVRDIANAVEAAGGTFELYDDGSITIAGIDNLTGSLVGTFNLVGQDTDGTSIDCSGVTYSTGSIIAEGSKFSDHGVTTAGMTYNIYSETGDLLVGNVSAVDSVADFFANLSAYGLEADITAEGRIAISDGYITGDFADELGISTEDYNTVVEGKTLVSGALSVTVQRTAELDNTLADIGVSGSNGLTINYNGVKKTETFASSSTLADVKAFVESTGAQLDLVDGFITISNAEATGDLADALGLTSQGGTPNEYQTTSLKMDLRTITIVTTATATAITTATAMVTVTSSATTTAITTQTITATVTSTAITTNSVTAWVTVTAIATETVTAVVNVSVTATSYSTTTYVDFYTTETVISGYTYTTIAGGSSAAVTEEFNAATGLRQNVVFQLDNLDASVTSNSFQLQVAGSSYFSLKSGETIVLGGGTSNPATLRISSSTTFRELFGFINAAGFGTCEYGQSGSKQVVSWHQAESPTWTVIASSNTDSGIVKAFRYGAVSSTYTYTVSAGSSTPDVTKCTGTTYVTNTLGTTYTTETIGTHYHTATAGDTVTETKTVTVTTVQSETTSLSVTVVTESTQSASRTITVSTTQTVVRTDTVVTTSTRIVIKTEIAQSTYIDYETLTLYHTDTTSCTYRNDDELVKDVVLTDFNASEATLNELGVVNGDITVKDEDANSTNTILNVTATSTLADLLAALQLNGYDAKYKDGRVFLYTDQNLTLDGLDGLNFTIATDTITYTHNKFSDDVFDNREEHNLTGDTVLGVFAPEGEDRVIELTLDGKIMNQTFSASSTVDDVINWFKAQGVTASINNGVFTAEDAYHEMQIGGALGEVLLGDNPTYTKTNTAGDYWIGDINDNISALGLTGDTKVVHLGVNTGGLKIYDNGTWINTAVYITENTTLNELKDMLDAFGIELGIDSTNKQLTLKSDSDKYLSDETSNFVSKLGLSVRNQSKVDVYDQTNSKTMTVITTTTLSRTTTLAELGFQSRASLRLEVDGVMQTMGFTSDETIQDIIDALSGYGIDASIENGIFTAFCESSEFELTGSVADKLNGNAPAYTPTEKILSYSNEIKTDVEYTADITTKFTTLGVKTGYFNVERNGEIIATVNVGENTTIQHVINSLSPYNIAATIDANGVFSIESVGDVRITDGTSDFVTKLGLDDTLEHCTFDGTTLVWREEVDDITEETLLSYFDTVDKKALGSLHFEVESQDGKKLATVVNIVEGETFGSFKEKLEKLGLTVTIKDGFFSFHNGLGSVNIVGGSSGLVDTLQIADANLEKWYQNPNEILVEQDEIRYDSIVNNADGNTKLSTLGVTSGEFSIGIDGAMVSVSVDENDTLNAVMNRIKAQTGNRVTASLTTDGRFQLEAADGVELFLGLSIDSTNLITIFDLDDNGSNKVVGTTTLYRACDQSKLTSAGLFRLGNVTTGTFKIGNATFTITNDTTIASLVNDINRNEEANATAYWDNLNGRLQLTSKTLGASYVDVTSGSSNFTEIFGLTVDDGGVERLATYNQKLGDNAILTINGTRVVSTSNTITEDVSRIEGLTVNIKDITAGESVTIKVERNTQALVDAVKETLENYNALIAELNNSLGMTGSLHGDVALNAIKNEMASILTASATNGATMFRNLAAVGISTEAANSVLTSDIYSLYLDEEQFIKALGESEAEVKLLLVGTVDNAGILTRVGNILESALSASGYFSTKTSAINRDIANFDNKIAKITQQTEAYKSLLERKFSNMENLYSTMQAAYSNLSMAHF